MCNRLRRWPRFSLRTLFIIVTACGLASPALPDLLKRYRQWRIARDWAEVRGPGIIYGLDISTHCVFESNDGAADAASEDPPLAQADQSAD
jgi:hypothetical protein